MIKSFKDKEVERIFNREISRKFHYSIQKAALRKLLVLDAALSINDLRVPPANHLERLQGKRAGQYSVRINDQWRICFVWENGSVFQVEIIDYH